MLTVKHINIAGQEHIRSCHEAKYVPPHENCGSGIQANYAVVQAFDEKGVAEIFSGGTVFVMNDFGKTVARYDLGASPVPIIGNGLSDPRPTGAGRFSATAYPPGMQATG